MDAENLGTTGIQSPDHPAHSKVCIYFIQCNIQNVDPQSDRRNYVNMSRHTRVRRGVLTLQGVTDLHNLHRTCNVASTAKSREL